MDMYDEDELQHLSTYKPIRKGGFAAKKEASVAAAQVEANIVQEVIGVKKDIAFAQF